ncbi:SLAF1 protein, partial [Rhadina sibilatrix]|nr:SLAF1 protein [Rhadina sibilatrix]
RKKFLLKLWGGNYTELEPGRVRFHRSDFSLEILNTSREDGQIYEYSVSKGQEEDVWQVQLEVLEPVSHPSIRILGWELSNGSCSLALLCTAERGDEVSYSWESRGDNGKDSSGSGIGSGSGSGIGSGPGIGSGSGLCSGQGALLNLSFPLPGAALGCVCTARNPVSSGSAALQPGHCG